MEEKAALMKKLGGKQLTLQLLVHWQNCRLRWRRKNSTAADGFELVYTYDGRQEEEGEDLYLLTQQSRRASALKITHPASSWKISSWTW